MRETAYSRSLKHRFDGTYLRVENRAYPGTADVSYQVHRGPDGWLELKIGCEKRNGIVRVKDFTTKQVNFLRMWNVHGNAALLVCVERCDKTKLSILIPGSAQGVLRSLRDGTASVAVLTAAAIWHGEKLDGKLLCKVLRTVYD